MFENLISGALKARNSAYAPYSDYLVGAAVLCSSGKIFTGCNVENSSFGATCCAERTAIFKAVSEGERKISAICIAGGKRGEKIETFAYPCGICRQVMSEFADDDMKVIVAKSENDYKVMDFKDLLPFAFTKENI